MVPAYVDLGSQKNGDTWEGLVIGPVVDQDNNPLPNPCVSCNLTFTGAVSEDIGFQLSSDSLIGGITIVDSNTWEFNIPAVILPLDIGSWKWYFETFDSVGTKRTLYEGDLAIIGV